MSQRRGDDVPLLARVDDNGEHVVPRGFVVLVGGQYYREVPRPPARSLVSPQGASQRLTGWAFAQAPVVIA